MRALLASWAEASSLQGAGLVRTKVASWLMMVEITTSAARTLEKNTEAADIIDFFVGPGGFILEVG